MPTTGTTAFDMDFAEIAEEAWERAGKELRSGYQLRTARRSMNLLTIEWQNRGHNFWTIDSDTIPLVTGTAQYDLPADTIDLVDHIIRTGTGTNQSDLSISRIDYNQYATIPAKNTRGRPVQVYIERLAVPRINVWPVPESDDYTFVYWRLRRIQDAGSGVETPDVVFRFYPALVSGLAYYIAMKDPELEKRVMLLKEEYEQQYRLAAEQDRMKTPLRLTPRLRGY